MSKLSLPGLTLGVGITWGLGMLLLGWAAGGLDWGTHMVDVLSSLYIGYDSSFLGGIIGGIWGFVDGAIGGFFVALFYNLFSK